MARCKYLLPSTVHNNKMSGPGGMRQTDYLLQLLSALTLDGQKVCVFYILYSPSAGSFLSRTDNPAYPEEDYYICTPNGTHHL